MIRAEEFEELRPLLFAIAYRIFGSVRGAEDAVQESGFAWGPSDTTQVDRGPLLDHGGLDLDRRAALGPRLTL